ncbi:MAG: (2Fe-2S) ferredoxin domain-containing protein [Firmicutes bacterium]|nr:(2Fe-2S) ferredoxin domain-containing protein [Bacillota bacterium]
MKITVCIGSSCHLKGSRQIVEGLQQRVQEHGLDSRIELAGAFCMGHCAEGVNVTIDGERFSVHPETLDSFFNSEVLPRLQ